MKERTPNFEGPIHGVTLLQPQQCKDCIYRDKTTITLDGKPHELGWDRDTCGVYTYPEWKPNPVMKNKVKCPHYEKEGAV